MLERYRNVGRFLQGAGLVLEVGCGDGTGGLVVRQYIDQLIGVDLNHTMLRQELFPAFVHDILGGPYETNDLDGVYALDVLEHIPAEQEDQALLNMRHCLKPFGKCVIGMPSLESQVHASPNSKALHVNCKTEDDLRATMERHFHAVFMFGMNDATLHTGFGPMCHYRLAVCVGKR